MARRKRDREADRAEAIVKLVIIGLMTLALAIGGLGGFAQTFAGLVRIALIIVVVGIAGYIGYAIYRRSGQPTSMSSSGVFPSTQMPSPAHPAPGPQLKWNAATIGHSLGEIDWFQFEKFCAALLSSDGFTVERKGGAHPDGGVDLIAVKGTERILVQCKHWRTWTVQEKVIREMLGSMTHFGATRGAIYTLNGWTKPAAGFAAQHSIELVDGESLSRRAETRLPVELLERLLNTREHHCPKCEAPMVWRTGNFKSFWGCSTYPRCRGTLKNVGAR
ncbi:MAG TPA: restriction endonuclease [Opitutaceae bacterium]|nr:restriction endonuclease [Opitutaceae bacterium]